jgi:hypothetical protein
MKTSDFKLGTRVVLRMGSEGYTSYNGDYFYDSRIIGLIPNSSSCGREGGEWNHFLMVTSKGMTFTTAKLNEYICNYKSFIHLSNIDVYIGSRAEFFSIENGVDITGHFASTF